MEKRTEAVHTDVFLLGSLCVFQETSLVEGPERKHRVHLFKRSNRHRPLCKCGAIQGQYLCVATATPR